MSALKDALIIYGSGHRRKERTGCLERRYSGGNWITAPQTAIFVQLANLYLVTRVVGI